MKKAQHLIRLATILSAKYASIDAESLRPEVEKTIRTAIFNASQQPSSGIMPFTQMADQDQANVDFYVMRDGRNIKAYDLRVSPDASLVSKYQPLLGQVQDYLSKYWELYPSKRDGEDVSYNAFTVHVVYPSENTTDGSV